MRKGREAARAWGQYSRATSTQATSAATSRTSSPRKSDKVLFQVTLTLATLAVIPQTRLPVLLGLKAQRQSMVLETQ
jgi:hypothetical protein